MKDDQVILKVNNQTKEIELPKYGEIKLIVQNGKITASQVTSNTKHY